MFFASKGNIIAASKFHSNSFIKSILKKNHKIKSMKPSTILDKIFQYSFLIIVFLFSIQLSAQDDSILIEAEMKDGTTILGTLVEDNETHLILESNTIGRVSIDKIKIKFYKSVSKSLIAKENGWFENPNATRNIFSPTGYGLKKNEGYYQNFMLGVNQFSYGITDRFTIGLTLEAFTLIATVNGVIDSPVFAITPKYSIPVKEDVYNIAVGVMIVNIPETEQLFDWNLFYVVNTFGSKDRNVSVGLAYGLKDGELAERPTFTLSGVLRISPRLSLITENWFIPEREDSQAFNLFGIRITGKKVSWDLCLIGTKIEDGWKSGSSYLLIPIPVAGITIPFGKGWTK
ncbi:MAG: hypothetical protein ACI85O_003054 [Saprospiraceae bacterium]|jgi:hypothetical protein